MPVRTFQLGRKGERIAVRLLKSLQLSIRELNFRCSFGEIDIIAEDKGVIVFVEVKTRSNANYGLPEEAVDYSKQKKLSQVALFYLQKEQLEDRMCRFDVISIIMKKNKIERVAHIIDAFSA
ncbi:MAG: YraN family protein [bacterium]